MCADDRMSEVVRAVGAAMCIDMVSNGFLMD